ncbi:MAG: hypothetical protein ABIR96_09145 [Bdellovibrionota bacterium]
MKLSQLSLLAFTALVAVPAMARTAVLRKDPKTQQNYFLSENEDIKQSRLSVGWTLPQDEDFNFEKIAANDESYINANDDKIREAAVNVLVDLKTGSVVEELDQIKEEFTTCVWYLDQGCNHTGIYAMYNDTTKLAQVIGEGKWDTRYVSLEVMNETADGLVVRAKTSNIIPIVKNDLKVRLDSEKNSDALYRRDRDSLSLMINKISATAATNSAATTTFKLKVETDLEVAKGDGTFSASPVLDYVMNLRTGYESLALELVNKK